MYEPGPGDRASAGGARGSRVTDKGSGLATSGSGRSRCQSGPLVAGGAYLRGGANPPETRASQGPLQRRHAFTGRLARPTPDLRTTGQLGAIQGPYIGE